METASEPCARHWTVRHNLLIVWCGLTPVGAKSQRNRAAGAERWDEEDVGTREFECGTRSTVCAIDVEVRVAATIEVATQIYMHLATGLVLKPCC